MATTDVTEQGAPLALRPEIAMAWRRANLCGLEPGAALGDVPLTDVDRESRLMVAARPVLDALAEHLAGTRFSVLLADSKARIVDRRLGHPRLADALDDVRAAPGHEYLEQTTGTNALATAFEVRRGITVTGEEHFLESLKQFCCYGHPILNPISGRLEGVLDLTGYAADATPLLVPVLKHATQDIEQRLLDGSRLSHQRMLTAFHAHSSRSSQPLLVLGEGLTLANDRATDLFDGSTQLTLRELAGEDGPERRDAMLPDGRRLALRCVPVAGADGAVLVEVLRQEKSRSVPRGRNVGAGQAVDEVAEYRRNRTRVLVCGEPGTGRTTTATRLAGDAPVLRVDAHDLSEVAALDRLVAPNHAEHGLVLVDDIHLLPPAVANRLARLMDASTTWFVLTSAPVAQLEGEHRALAARCPARLPTVALRTRRAELGTIADELLRGLRPDTGLRLGADARRALSHCPWPGNFAELKAVLAHAAGHRTGGVLTVADLPPEYRRTGGSRQLTAMEQAEFDAILGALRRCQGNKVHAAADLGIGRATLYRRLRVLGIDPHNHGG